MRREFWSLLVLLTVTLCAPSAGHAASITLEPLRDNTLYEDDGGALSNAQGTRLFAGATGGGSIRRPLVVFDVAGSVPPGATITAAQLTMTVAMTGAGPEPMSLHRLNADWGEGTSAAAGGQGGGAPATPGDATWLHTFFPTQFWTSPGGDFTPAASASTVVDQTGPYTWTSAAMVADVQGWLDDPATNFGWLGLGTEIGGGTSKAFHSRENSDPALRPALTLEFEADGDPVPATSPWHALVLMLAALGVATWVLRRRGRMNAD